VARISNNQAIEEICGSIFGQAFFLELAGIDSDLFEELPFEAIVLKLRQLTISNDTFPKVFAHFIREFAFGEFDAWRRLAEGLSEFEVHIRQAVQAESDALINIGFLQGFDASRQVTVNGPNCEKTWFYNPEADELSAGRWWNSPDEYWTIQTLNQFSEQLPLDDSITVPAQDQIYNVTISGQPNVYQINSIDDWTHLVTRWPNPRSVETSKTYDSNRLDFLRQIQYFEPNYGFMKQEFDGVYLSPAAYLALAYCDTQLVNGDWTTVLGWSPGITYWFSQRFLHAN
jgi:hypothetical protein